MAGKEKVFVVGGEKLKTGEIPSIMVWGETLPEAWEDAVCATWEFGTRIPTEYDQAEDPESRDGTMMVVVTTPFKEPRIHKALPCGLDELWVYTQEVVGGVHDSRVKEEGWSYSYHDRLFNWPEIGGWQKIEELVGQKIDLPFVDQINTLIVKLASTPHSRRTQAVTWNPLIDAEHHEPPCLQRIWCRVVKSESDLYLLEMNTNWRSRDAFKAAFMNMYAITELQRLMASKISEISGRKIGVGRYVDISDSFHIYGSYIRREEMDQFFDSINNLSFDKRTFRTDDPRVQSEFSVGKERLVNEKK